MPATPPSFRERRRLVWLGFCLFALLSALVVQFYRIQVVEHDKWNQKALAQHKGKVRIPFRRGTFWSNVSVKEGHPSTPQPLVLDVPKYHLHVDPKSIPAERRDEVSSQLTKLLECDVSAQLEKPSRNRQLVRWLDREQRELILAWWKPFARQNRLASNALFFVKDYQRSYPFGALLGQVLHTIRDHKDEKTKQGVPTGGLEAYFNDLLRGAEGARLVVHSPRSRLDIGRELYPPQHGVDITLTINHYLQAIAEEELELGVEKVEAKGGFAVVMDPHSGAILALAQYPFFRPADYRTYFNDPELIPHTTCQPITYAFEPGSVMKSLIMALCLMASEELEERGEPPLFDPEEKVAVDNSRFPGRSKPLRDLSHHRYLNLNMAIQKSSNIYMARIVERLVNRLGDEWLHDALGNTLHFGERTGIELPGESAGVVPKPGKLHPNGTLEWSKATPYSLAMGYNLQVNGLQLLRAYSILANGGTLVQPTLVKRIERIGADGKSEVLHDLDEQLSKRGSTQAIPPHICHRIVTAMKYVTRRRGSSFRGNIPGFTQVGKSGTSEKLVGGRYATDKHWSSFIGFVPAQNPLFLILVTIDEAKKQYIPGIGSTHFGGKCAAPVFREIALRSLTYLGATPDDPDRSDWVEESRELQKMYDLWNNY